MHAVCANAPQIGRNRIPRGGLPPGAACLTGHLARRMPNPAAAPPAVHPRLAVRGRQARSGRAHHPAPRGCRRVQSPVPPPLQPAWAGPSQERPPRHCIGIAVHHPTHHAALSAFPYRYAAAAAPLLVHCQGRCISQPLCPRMHHILQELLCLVQLPMYRLESSLQSPCTLRRSMCITQGAVQGAHRNTQRAQRCIVHCSAGWEGRGCWGGLRWGVGGVVAEPLDAQWGMFWKEVGIHVHTIL